MLLHFLMKCVDGCWTPAHKDLFSKREHRVCKANNSENQREGMKKFCVDMWKRLQCIISTLIKSIDEIYHRGGLKRSNMNNQLLS